MKLVARGRSNHPLCDDHLSEQRWTQALSATCLRAAEHGWQAGEALSTVHRAGAVGFYLEAIGDAFEALLQHLDVPNETDGDIREALFLVAQARAIPEPTSQDYARLLRLMKIATEAAEPATDKETAHERISFNQVNFARSETLRILKLVRNAIRKPIGSSARGEVTKPMLWVVPT